MSSSLGQGRRSSGLMNTLANPRGPAPLFRSNSNRAGPGDDLSDAEDAEAPTPGFTFPAPAESPISFISPFASASASQPVPLPVIRVDSSSAKQKPQQQQQRPFLTRQHESQPRPSLAPRKDLSRRGSAWPPHRRTELLQAEAEGATFGVGGPCDRRRASVDVAALSLPKSQLAVRRGSKRLRASRDEEEDRDDAEAYAYESADNKMANSRTSVFADHLAALLNHSLSLASGRGETSLDLFVRGEDLSPVRDQDDEQHQHRTLAVHQADPKDPAQTPSSPARGVVMPRPSSSSSLASEHAFAAQNSYSPATEAALASSPTAHNNFQHFRLRPKLSSPDLTGARRVKLIQHLTQWDFNALSLEPDELFECSALMFEAVLRMEGVKPNVSIERMRAFLLALQSAYHARNGYHNFTHATDVLQAIYSFLTTLGLAPPLSILLDGPSDSTTWARPAHVHAPGGVGQALRPMDVYSLMIAAIGHDVGHPGLSNAYLVNAKTPVAQVYGDKSVLENFHTVTLVQMLKSHGLGHLFGAADKGPAASDGDCRKVLFASILVTDMGQHFPFVAQLQEMAARLKDHPRTAQEAEEDRLLLCCGLMKCADISNPSRPHLVAKAWSTALLQEWSVQAKIEEEFKLPVSVMILNPAEAQAQAKSQVGFINLFTQPLFDAMASTLPDFDIFAQRCRDGRRVWEQVMLRSDDSGANGSSSLATAVPTLPSMSTPKPSTRSLATKTGSRRRPPPHPLNFGLRSRGSQDSSTSSGRWSPASSMYLLSPTSAATTAASSIASPQSTTTTTNTSECTGQCGFVTAKCLPCLRNEQTEASTSQAFGRRRDNGSDDTLVEWSSGGGVESPGEELELCDTWPPFPFYPTSATV